VGQRDWRACRGHSLPCPHHLPRIIANSAEFDPHANNGEAIHEPSNGGANITSIPQANNGKANKIFSA